MESRMSANRSAALDQARKFARSIVENEQYKTILIARANAGELSPQVETLLFHYAYGKPSEVIESRTTIEDLRSKATDELFAELDATRLRLREALEAREIARSLLSEIEAARQKEVDAATQQQSNVVHFGERLARPKTEVTH
jgi:hypothetical protein